MIGRGRRSTLASRDDGRAPAGTVLSEIEVLRIDATFRALPDHDSRPNGPSAAIDSSLMAAASIQASINRQRRHAVEPAPPPKRGLGSLASLAAFVIALVVLALVWDLGEKAYYDVPEQATLTPAPGAGPAPVERPGARAMPLSAPTPAPTAETPSNLPRAGTPSTEGRRMLHSRDRPAARHFGDAPSPASADRAAAAASVAASVASTSAAAASTPTTVAATSSALPAPSPAWQAWTTAPLPLP